MSVTYHSVITPLSAGNGRAACCVRYRVVERGVQVVYPGRWYMVVYRWCTISLVYLPVYLPGISLVYPWLSPRLPGWYTPGYILGYPAGISPWLYPWLYSPW